MSAAVEQARLFQAGVRLSMRPYLVLSQRVVPIAVLQLLRIIVHELHGLTLLVDNKILLERVEHEEEVVEDGAGQQG